MLNVYLSVKIEPANLSLNNHAFKNIFTDSFEHISFLKKAKTRKNRNILLNPCFVMFFCAVRAIYCFQNEISLFAFSIAYRI